MNELAKSKNFKIKNEYEVVFLEGNDEKQVVVGDFYGDPACAVISPDEKWCAIGGAGVDSLLFETAI